MAVQPASWCTGNSLSNKDFPEQNLSSNNNNILLQQ